MKKNFYMIGNAHLDPVWIWRWQEGSAEAKATLRSALDRMREDPDFKFVCSSVFVYECVEEFDPAMFEEIRARVREGRWIPVGGMYVQPDCNLPGGENFVRQTLYSQRYFLEKFGVTAKIGYNVDSFGHHWMLPQILKKSGMDRYIFMRPGQHEKKMPSNLFLWEAPDGSRVTAWRIQGTYCANVKTVEELEKRLEAVSDEGLDCTDSAMVFYGVGNHGGGPTRRNLAVIHEYQAAHPETKLVFADPLEFFEKIRAEGRELPVHADDLQHHAAGCYAAESDVKRFVRRCEQELTAAEVYALLGTRLLGRPWPGKKLRAAWRNLLFTDFHDSLCGCSVKPVYEDAAIFTGETRAIAQRETNNALQSISWAIDTSDAEKGTPVVVFNPNPWPSRVPVRLNADAPGVWLEGSPVPTQKVHSPALPVAGRQDTLFLAELPALGYRTYYLKEAGESAASCAVRAELRSRPCPPPAHREWMKGGKLAYELENELLLVQIDPHTGFVSSVTDKRSGRELMAGDGAVPVVLDEFEHDTWSHAMDSFTNEIARFGDAEIRVLENGPVRAAVRVRTRYNDSVLTQYFSLLSGSDRLDVRCRLDWHEKHKMLKLAWTLNLTAPEALYEIPFGYIRRPCNGEEEPGQRWVAMEGREGRTAMLNDGKYSFSFRENTMYLTAARSPIFCDHGNVRDEECDFTDQGEQTFRYSILAADGYAKAEILRAAGELNARPTVIMENNHAGSLPDRFQGLESSDPGVVVTALKRSEDGTGLILRAVETEGKTARVTFRGGLLPAALTASFSGHSVRTFLLPDGEADWREVLMTELPIENETEESK